MKSCKFENFLKNESSGVGSASKLLAHARELANPDLVGDEVRAQQGKRMVTFAVHFAVRRFH